MPASQEFYNWMNFQGCKICTLIHFYYSRAISNLQSDVLTILEDYATFQRNGGQNFFFQKRPKFLKNDHIWKATTRGSRGSRNNIILRIGIKVVIKTPNVMWCLNLNWCPFRSYGRGRRLWHAHDFGSLKGPGRDGGRDWISGLLDCPSAAFWTSDRRWISLVFRIERWTFVLRLFYCIWGRRFCPKIKNSSRIFLEKSLFSAYLVQVG